MNSYQYTYYLLYFYLHPKRRIVVATQIPSHVRTQPLVLISIFLSLSFYA
jgi:hypothetical protein